MHYDAIILGATFTAAGLLQEYGKNCLVLERRPQAGYEFLNALSFGVYTRQPVTEEARSLLTEFENRGVFSGEYVCLFPAAPVLYQMLEGNHVLLNMEIPEIQRKNELFSVTAHGVSGYRTFHARRVIDTRVHPRQIVSKSLNLLVNTDDDTTPMIPGGIPTEKWGFDKDLTVKCPVPVEADYLQARKTVALLLRTLPENCKTALVADCFDYQLKDEIRTEDNGTEHLPSKGFQNPILAFDAGVLYARGGKA